ncbi:hypothetical protein PFICI_06491 [Pestalotiopsis fici W106-1]|uniref:Uncharacterized protein n=1 Tax=Pestalotiopsis fici (strain W106-1 / CGMCC3.15140) TaxID=1229662 RepID=W3X627_PESFW|nr:uncharacterized protein PFICI_06491 [Pestalotiopsis fici W106-1]ETS81489.1 hypothetical protein PFICI_06491 [Pestalotiopsis fici W106-1]
MSPAGQNGRDRAESVVVENVSYTHAMLRPPIRLYSESIPQVDPILREFAYLERATTDPDFAVQANEQVNASLGRTPGGLSVIDPNSVLGDSGRLYHGYKDGKYYFPNDAVRTIAYTMKFAC